MVIYLAGETEEPELRLDELTPRQIVAELDKHVVGQNAAKRAVAIALRNRVRRKKLAPDLAADVIPKNIIMIGSTWRRQNRNRQASGPDVQFPRF
jgi:ATP-dependent HslUV protease ATP-binding subunit HslU